MLYYWWDIYRRMEHSQWTLRAVSSL